MVRPGCPVVFRSASPVRDKVRIRVRDKVDVKVSDGVWVGTFYFFHSSRLQKPAFYP